MRIMKIRASLFFAITFTLLLAAEGVIAQTPTLEGETLQSSRADKINCDNTSGQLGIEIRGTATGPYAGEFYEIGTLFFDPVSSQVTGGSLDFTIFTTTQKTVHGVNVPKEGTISCTNDPKAGISNVSLTISVLSYSADLLVEMTTDEGHTTLDLSSSTDTSTKPPTTRLQFTQIFHSSSFVPSTPGKVTGGGTIVPPDSKNGITFGFNAQNQNEQMKGAGTIINHTAGAKVKILDVATFAIVGTHATFTGRAEVNGVEEKYRIDVDDAGEPGAGLDSFKIVTDTYAGGGTLTGGNIQVHK